MKLEIETTLKNEKAVRLVNAAISYANTFRTIDEVLMNLKRMIINLKAQHEFICGKGSHHIWLTYKDNKSRILLISE